MKNNAPAPGPDDLGLRFDVVDLIGRVGSHRHVEQSVVVGEQRIGNLAMTVPAGESIEVEAELESVVEGIYAGGTVRAHLTGECSRCLDPVEQDVIARIDELFSYPEKVKKDEEDDVVMLSGDEVDLGVLAHDALALEAEDRPLCSPDCMGLCPQCGKHLEEDPDHSHDLIDTRWAALTALLGEDATDEQTGTDAASTGEQAERD
ncbi:DUF177 domain-containing protein [Brachybacterium sp. JHP9]|uniref:DUF177 domain-containing protein n=1 Tax=Brachybacterium equifaecis TaxID=2910770 RepID=A0ABT0R3Q3_9MICO|nr:DUF177 domain-containing protein [Brachybacterium equifaecis]